MIISTKEFFDFFKKEIEDGEDFFLNLLKTVIDNPTRYCGLFRLSNAKMKLVQNITQSKEIKFGNVIEELITQYIEKMGYTNLDKNIGANENKENLLLDQFFSDDNTLYMVEMKIRDDHDSTKKRGQFSNFVKKINLIRNKCPNKSLIAIMWFVDKSLAKNKSYYQYEINNLVIPNTKIFLFYESEFFKILKNGEQAWNELIYLLSEYKKLNSYSEVHVPDFGTSKDILNALLLLDEKYWNKLNSFEEKYIALRKELFSNGDNLIKAKEQRLKLKKDVKGLAR